MLLCKFCSKECKNDNSLRNHERLCKSNPAKQISWLEVNRDSYSHSNASIKANSEGREHIVSQITRDKISAAHLDRDPEIAKEAGKKISKTIAKKVEAGTWHTSLAKNMHYNYNGVDLHGTWELNYAKYLDLNCIKWIRNKDIFSYIFDGKDRKYTPDFYLIESDEYIEIKGYKTEKDSAKWSQFPSHRKLQVLMKKELLALDIKIKV